jgi:hypothetical protein
MSAVTIADIKTKLESLLQRVDKIVEQRDILLLENARLSEALEHNRKDLTAKSAQIEELNLKMAQVQVSTPSESADKKRIEIKEKIRELAGEIDKCIALLNQ